MFVAAARSSTGGSAAVLVLCESGLARAVTSQLVLREAELNMGEKMSRDALLRFYRLLGGTPLEVAEPPTKEEIPRFSRVISERDAHVLAAGFKARADFILTLDRQHFMRPEVSKAVVPIMILTPGEFLKRL